MKPQDVAASYDRMASHWDGADFNRANGIDQHRRALRFRAAPGVALDVGCGSSGRFIDLLRETGYEVEGPDLSQEMLRLARRRHPDVLFHHADVCTWRPPQRYDFISAWDSIWHVPLAQQEAVLRKLCAALAPGGVFIFTTGGVDAPGEKHDPCMDQPMYHAAPGLPNVLRALGEAGCVCRHLEYDQPPSPHVYLIVQKL